MAGKDKGRTGTVEKVFIKAGKILVGGVNIYKKHAKSRDGKDKGGIIDITKPLPASSLSLICPKCGKVVRVGYQVEKSGEKNRICKKCKEVI